ncbi:MAG TPA: HAMP domain-containing histidine kinase [Candidatus Butyricicoccus avicola]|nr:HAMP domain-containing histidine kinase [Candidatus Butyricicoccus avicola]
MKRTFFAKNFISSVILILVVFGLAGGTFFYQIDRYAKSEKVLQLDATAQSIAELTSLAVQTGDTLNVAVLDASLKNTAKQNQMSILLTDLSGNILLRVEPDRGSSRDSGRIPASVVDRLIQDQKYTGVGTLDGQFSGSHYVVGTLCEDAAGNDLALVFIAANSERVVGMLQEITQMFLIIIVIALIGTLIVSYFLSSRMTRPLKTMANAAKEFAAGDFSVRVPEDNHCDEIDELATSFNNMARDLEQLEELTQGFIGNVSHEFKTPMTTISGFVDGMLDGTIPQDQQKKYLHIISEEVKRLSRMTMSMLAAAKIQSGELIISPVPFDFSEMASQILLSFEQKITAKNIEVDADLADRLMVMGDRDHVFRAVYNLVDNAVKFINEGGTLRVTAYPAGAFCEFSISNTGDGIAPEDIPHVFDRFYKTDRSRSRDRSGAGLGLYIVKNIINLHGGDISVRSDGGETEFSFTLPLAPAAKPPKNAK